MTLLFDLNVVLISQKGHIHKNSIAYVINGVEITSISFKRSFGAVTSDDQLLVGNEKLIQYNSVS